MSGPGLFIEGYPWLGRQNGRMNSISCEVAKDQRASKFPGLLDRLIDRAIFRATSSWHTRSGS